MATRYSQGALERPWNAKEVADYLHLSQRYVYQLTRDGVLPAVKRGRRWYYSPSAVRAWLGL